MRTSPMTHQSSAVKRVWLLTILVYVDISLSGCEIVEYLWLVPRSEKEVSISSTQTNAEVLDAFEKTMTESKVPMWPKPLVTYRNVGKGVVEIGPFRERAIAGYTARASIDRRNGLVKVVVKGAGPYYSELPVDEVAEKIAVALSNRLRE
jgi:hypothetical protein